MYQSPIKFEVRTRHTFCFNINRPGVLDLWPFDSNLVPIITRRVGNLSTNFGISGTYCYWLIGQHLSDRPRDLATLTFNLGGHGTCGWYGSSCSICITRLNFLGLPIRKIWHTFGLIISRLGDLDLWPRPWNWWAILPMGWATFLPISVMPGLFVLDLWANNCRTYHVTSRPWPLTLDVMALVGDGDTGLRFSSVIKLEVHRYFHSEDMMHFRSQH